MDFSWQSIKMDHKFFLYADVKQCNNTPQTFCRALHVTPD